jgi:hypothetical protein
MLDRVWLGWSDAQTVALHTILYNGGDEASEHGSLHFALKDGSIRGRTAFIEGLVVDVRRMSPGVCLIVMMA